MSLSGTLKRGTSPTTETLTTSPCRFKVKPQRLQITARCFDVLSVVLEVELVAGCLFPSVVAVQVYSHLLAVLKPALGWNWFISQVLG